LQRFVKVLLRHQKRSKTMLSKIVSSTPLWVWALLLALSCLGASQIVSRAPSRARVVRISILMAAFSLYGTISAFGADLQVLTCWLAAAGAVAWGVLRIPLAGGTRYLAETRAFEVPGSWVPLALMLGIFAVKYLAGVLIGMQVPVVRAALFGPMLGVVYGAVSGVFLGRAGRLIRLARQSRTAARAYHAL
jgi:hypothetical protein